MVEVEVVNVVQLKGNLEVEELEMSVTVAEMVKVDQPQVKMNLRSASICPLCRRKEKLNHIHILPE